MFFKPVLIVVAVILLLIILAGIFGCSRRSSHLSHEKRAEWIVKKISKELDLNDSQNAKLNEIKQDIFNKHQSFSASKSEIMDALKKQLRKDAIDETELNALFESKESEFKEMRTFVISRFAEFHAMLTPEQRAKLADKMSEFHDKCGQ